MGLGGKEQPSIESLPDKVLLRVFSFLKHAEMMKYSAMKGGKRPGEGPEKGGRKIFAEREVSKKAEAIRNESSRIRRLTLSESGPLIGSQKCCGDSCLMAADGATTDIQMSSREAAGGASRAGARLSSGRRRVKTRD